MKWIRQYEGPFLVVKTPSSVTATIQRTAKAKPKTVHIDKLKEYVGKPPKPWPVSAHERNVVDDTSPLDGAPFDGEVLSPTDEIRFHHEKSGETNEVRRTWFQAKPKRPYPKMFEMGRSRRMIMFQTTQRKGR